MRKRLKKILGSAVCGMVLLLPYRLRVAASDLLGRFINSLYHGYVLLLRWFLKQIKD